MSLQGLNDSKHWRDRAVEMRVLSDVRARSWHAHRLQNCEPPDRPPQRPSPARCAARCRCRRQLREATSASEPRDHRQMDAVALGDLGQRFARSAALDRFSSLVVAQLAVAAEFDAGGHSTLAAFASTLAN
jgi:hypothetical protein